MLKIWGGLGRPNWQEEGDRRKSIQKQRDEAIRQLVPLEKQAELDKITEGYTRQMAEMAEQRHQAFAAAVEKTKAILTPEQRKKYDEVLARKSEGRRAGGHEWGRGSATAPASDDPAVSKPNPGTNPPAAP
jgi:Spy/CpxP family protein refolding chaperone